MPSTVQSLQLSESKKQDSSNTNSEKPPTVASTHTNNTNKTDNQSEQSGMSMSSKKDTKKDTGKKASGGKKASSRKDSGGRKHSGGDKGQSAKKESGGDKKGPSAKKSGGDKKGPSGKRRGQQQTSEATLIDNSASKSVQSGVQSVQKPASADASARDWPKGSVRTVLNKQQVRTGHQTDSEQLRQGFAMAKDIPKLTAPHPTATAEEASDQLPQIKRRTSVIPGLARLRPAPLPVWPITEQQLRLMGAVYGGVLAITLILYIILMVVL